MIRFTATLPHVLAVSTTLMVGTSLADSHTTIITKNTPTNFATRTEQEGTTAFTALSISHGCSAPDSTLSKPVIAQSILFPNGANSIATIGDTVVNLSEHIEGNAVMAPTPVQNHNVFQFISVLQGPVPLFTQHGEKTEDNRAFQYKSGYLQTDLVGVVPFRVTFPTIKETSCVSSLTINLAVANYCTRSNHDPDRADIWIGQLTPLFNDATVVSVGFWPSVDVVRDRENNPLPASCDVGEHLVITPSNEDIDRYLPLSGFWPIKVLPGRPPEDSALPGETL